MRSLLFLLLLTLVAAGQAEASADIDQVFVPATNVVRGQHTVPVRVSVFNPGPADITVESVGLTFTPTGAANPCSNSVTPEATNPTTIGAGNTASFDFKVSICGTATLGLQTVDATFLGHETSSPGNRADDTGAFVTDSFTVLTPANLTLLSATTISNPKVVRGDTSSNVTIVTLTVRNTGQSTAVMDFANTNPTFNGSKNGYGIVFPGSPGGPGVPGGISASFSYDVTISSTAPLGLTVVNGTVRGTDLQDPILATTDNTADLTSTFTVFNPAKLVPVLQPLPNFNNDVTRTFNALVSVTNTGQSTADLQSTGLLTFSGTSFMIGPGTLNATNHILPGQTLTDTFPVTLTAPAATGNITATYSISGADNINNDFVINLNQVPLGRATTIQTPAAFGTTTLQLPATISRGQTLTATLSSINTGQATGTVRLAQLTFSAPGITATTPAGNPILLRSGTSSAFKFNVNVPHLSALGTVTTSFSIQMSDNNNALSILKASNASAGTFTVTNVKPTAIPGSNQTLGIGVLTASLDGGASFDGPDPSHTEGDPLTYTWMVTTKPLLSTAGFSVNGTVSASRPTLTIDKKGVYTVQLVVNDTHDDSPPSTLTVTLPNAAPVANAGPNKSATVGVPVALSGSATDADDQPSAISYLWEVDTRPAGSAAGPASFVPTSSTTQANTSFRPDVIGVYVLRLEVQDGTDFGSPSFVTITAGPANRAPSASATAPATVPIPGRASLDGSASRDPDGDLLTFQWRVVSVPAGSAITTASLVPNNSRSAAITRFFPDVAGQYRFGLTVTDGNLSANSPLVTVVAVDGAPVASVAARVTASVARRAELDGSASRDPEGAALTYKWRIASKPAGSIVGNASFASNDSSQASRTSFQPDKKGNYAVELQVNDGRNDSKKTTCTVEMLNTAPVAVPGPSLAGTVAQTVALDGTGSFDRDPGDTLVYSWFLSAKPGGSQLGSDPFVRNNSAAAGTTAFRPDVAGTYEIELEVNDGTSSSIPQLLTVQARAASGAPIITDLVPGSVLISRATLVTIRGAGFTGATSVKIVGPASASLTFSFVDDSTITATFPTGLAGGDYEIQVAVPGQAVARDLIRVVAPAEIVVRAGETGLVRFGPQNDRDDTAANIQANLRAVGLDLPAGAGLTLTLRDVTRPDADLGSSLSAVIGGACLFEGVPLDTHITYVGTLSANQLDVPGKFVLAADGPPAARITSTLSKERRPQSILLDGSASVGGTGALGYQWSLGDAPQNAQSLDSTLPVTTYDAFRPGSYALRLTVSDSAGRSSTASIFFSVDNVAPFASAGSPQTLILPDSQGRIPADQTGTSVSLDGSGSDDANGDLLTYSWSLVSKPAGSTFNAAASLNGSLTSRAQANFTTATGQNGKLLDAGDYVFALTVRDPGFASSTTTVAVRVFDPNQLVPAADAGIDRSVAVTLLQTNPVRLEADIFDPAGATTTSVVDFIRLDARRSSDPNIPAQPLAYQWTILRKPPGSAVIVLGAGATPLARFTPDRAGDYTFRVTVANLRYSSSDDVVVHVIFRETNRPPRVEASLESPVPAPAAGELPVFIAGVNRVRLLGSGSSDPDPGDRLSYSWVQLTGPSVALQPGADAANPAFVPTLAGLYSFRLVVTDDSGNTAEAKPVTLLARTILDTLPTLSVVASSPTTEATGADFAPDDRETRPRSLRIRLGTSVALTARTSDPDVGTPPLQQSLVYSFSQLSGPTVLLTRPTTGTQFRAVATFTPTTFGVAAFEVRASELDSFGNDTRVSVARQIRVVVDSDAEGIPEAHASFHAKTEIAACATIFLDGSGSTDRGANATGTLQYRWVQTSGPNVLLSNPFSPIVTFVVPDLRDDRPADFSFQLFADDGKERSEPDPVSLRVSPTGNRSGGVRLGGRLSFVTVPIDPSGQTRYRISDLISLTGATAVVGLSSPEDGSPPVFRVWHPGLRSLTDPVTGGAGYLILRPSSTAVMMNVAGTRWSTANTTRRLTRGLNFVGYPGTVPDGETTASLVRRSGATFVVETGDLSGNRAMRVYSPGVSPAFAIQAGKGYLLSVPGSREMTFPSCDE